MTSKFHWRFILFLINILFALPIFGINDSSFLTKYNHDFILLKNNLNTIPLKKLEAKKLHLLIFPIQDILIFNRLLIYILMLTIFALIPLVLNE